jgi:hypothetical protein
VTDAVTIAGRNGVRLEFRPVVNRVADHPDQLPRWRVSLVGPGVSAEVEAPEASWEPQSLADFLGDVARDWRGWDGERAWQSEETELRLTVRHNRINTVLMQVELEDGAPPRWRCETELELDPGAFQQLAEDARELGDPPAA